MTLIICRSRKQVKSLISEVERSTNCKYVHLKYTLPFNKEDWQPSKKDIIFFDRKPRGKSYGIPFSGNPFVSIGLKYLACHQGKDRCLRQKEKRHKNMTNKFPEKKRKCWLQTTKKVGCPAVLYIYRVAAFLDQEFQIVKNTNYEKRMSSDSLKDTLSNNENVTWEIRYYVYLPKLEDHIGHPIITEDTTIHEPIDPKVEERIKELTKSGLVINVPQMQAYVKDYVKNTLFKDKDPSSLLHRGYFPLDSDVRRIMKGAQDVTALNSTEDHMNMQNLVHSWKEKNPKSSIFLRLHQETKGFLLCLQTKWQRRLLQMYGKEICLLDSAFKIANGISRLFLYVRTNVSYVVVAVLFIQQDTEEAISEALKVVKDWNDGWSPDHFIVGFNKTEMNAVESIFPGCRAVFSDYHREKTWEEWITNPYNEVKNQDETMSLLKRIASADTIDKYHKAVKKLQDSREWIRNFHFQNWFQTEWMPEAVRWVTVFREGTLHMNITTNNGIQRLNETFKSSNLSSNKANKILEIISFAVDEFIPELYKKYSKLNLQASSGFRKYNCAVPAFLHNRPRDMVRHIMQRFQTNIDHDNVTNVSDGQFEVKSELVLGEIFCVSLGSNNTYALPSCDCDDWKKNLLPCKHFCAIFKYGRTWDNLCPSYRDNPLFHLDPHHSTNSGDIPGPCEDPDDSLYPNEVIIEENSFDWDQDNEINLSQHNELPIDPVIMNNSESNIYSSQQQCVESLNNLITLVPLLENRDFLNNIKGVLQDLEEKVQSKIPQEVRMALNCSIKRKLDIPKSDAKLFSQGEFGYSKVKICGCHQPEIVHSPDVITLEIN